MKYYHTTARRRQDAAEVKTLARGRWLSILGTLAPSLGEAVARHPKHVPCPVHGGTDGFRLFGNADETGGGICNTCGPHADGFATLRWANGWTFLEALKAVADHLDLDANAPPPRHNPTPPRPVTPPPKPDPRKAARLRQIWREAGPLRAGDPVARYLEARGLDLAGLSAETVRTHPGLDFWHDGRVVGTFPAMLARVTGPDGAAVAIHATYLDPDHPGRKAAVSAPRKLWTTHQGATRGAAVRLYPLDGPRLAVAEGIETAAAVHLLAGIPCWSTLSAGGLERVALPPTVREVVVCADHDTNSTGQRAAEALAARLVAEGRTVRVAIPPKPGDFLDMLTKGCAA